MRRLIEGSGFDLKDYIELTFYEKWIIFWRLLKTKHISSEYTIKELLLDGF